MSHSAPVLRSPYKPQIKFCRIKDNLQDFVTSLGKFVYSLCTLEELLIFLRWKVGMERAKMSNIGKIKGIDSTLSFLPSKNIIYFIFISFPFMVSFLLYWHQMHLTLFSRWRHGCQCQNPVFFNAPRQWITLVFRVASVTAGSMGSIEKKHTATTEKFPQYEERQQQWKAQCFRPWLLISQMLIHNTVHFLK